VNYIGIDPSLTSTGISVVNDEGKLIDGRAVVTKYTGPQRLVLIRDAVKLFLAIHNPAMVCIEGYAMGAKWGREAAGELGGILRVLFWECGLTWKEVAPPQLKKFITGKGVAEKDHILLAVYKKYGEEFKSNDEADAFVLAQIARAMDKPHTANLLSYEREVIEAIRNPKKKKEAS
jgi:crossover junction endodeoxyribonuclease RuvC